MHTKWWLLLALAMPFTAFADCAQDADAVRACFHQWETTHPVTAANGADTVEKLLAYARSTAADLHYSQAMIRTCAEQGQAFERSCRDSKELLAGLTKDLLPIARVMMKNAEVSEAAMNKTVEKANSLAGKKLYASICYLKPLNEGGFRFCFIVDKTASDHEFVKAEDADSLPVRVGMTHDCTFFADAEGRIISADHCGQKHMDGGFLFAPGGPSVRAQPAQRLQFVQNGFENGGAIEDFSVFQSEQALPNPGKPLYYFALDESVKNGCEMREDTVLACTKQAAQALNGMRAELIGFPIWYYNGDIGMFRKTAPVTALHVRGTLTFDAEFERFFVGMYAQGGASGGPVYLPAGTEIAGLRLDRPLVLGPLTGYAGSLGTPDEGWLTDNVAIVAAVHYPKLAKVLSLERLQYATSTDQ
jgi:hypothetical protein